MAAKLLEENFCCNGFSVQILGVIKFKNSEHRFIFLSVDYYFSQYKIANYSYLLNNKFKGFYL